MFWEVWTSSTLGLPVLTVNLWRTAVNKMDETISLTPAAPGRSHSSRRSRCRLQAPAPRRAGHINHHFPRNAQNNLINTWEEESVSRLLYLLEYNNLLILQPKHGVKGNRACLMLSDVGGVTLSGGLWLGSHLSQRLCQPVHSDYVNKLWKSLPIMLTWKVLNIEKQLLSDEFYPTNKHIQLDGDC